MYANSESSRQLLQCNVLCPPAQDEWQDCLLLSPGQTSSRIAALTDQRLLRSPMFFSQLLVTITAVSRLSGATLKQSILTLLVVSSDSKSEESTLTPCGVITIRGVYSKFQLHLGCNSGGHQETTFWPYGGTCVVLYTLGDPKSIKSIEYHDLFFCLLLA